MCLVNQAESVDFISRNSSIYESFCGPMSFLSTDLALVDELAQQTWFQTIRHFLRQSICHNCGER